MESNHIAYENMLGVGLMMQIFEDDMKRTWNEQMDKIQHAQKLKGKQKKKGKVGNGQVITLCPFESHKTPNGHHHLNPCIFIPQNHIIYGTI